jgi:hypothetical protein
MALVLNLDAKMFAEALEAHIRAVLVVVVLLMGKQRKTILGDIVSAYDAWLSRYCGFLANWCFVDIVVVNVALPFHSSLRGC